MTIEEKYKITSDEYTDLFIEYNRNPSLLERYPNSTTHLMNARYAIAYVPSSILNQNFIENYGYTPLPYCYGLTSERSLEASGVKKLRNIPTFNLGGSGVIVGIVDTGIDYTNPIFRREDGSSKILALWDQTIDSQDQYPKGEFTDTFYGTVYRREQINEAILSDQPLTLVPSTDEIGHGTMLAGIAVGSEVLSSGFSGVAPDADIIVVKLKQVKPHLRSFYLIPSDVPCYQENDILWGIDFIQKESFRQNRPLSLCLGLGTSQGPHANSGPLAQSFSIVANMTGICVCIGVGNEGDKRRHVSGLIDTSLGYSSVELNISSEDEGVWLELRGQPPNTYSVEVISPSGESTQQLQESIRTNSRFDFIFGTTTLIINYFLIATRSGKQMILMRFLTPNPGIWKINIFTTGDLIGSYHMWLPMNGFISVNTYFLNSNPYTTIISPGDAITPIGLTAYNPETENLYLGASKGFSVLGDIKPDLAAPGDMILVPTLQKDFSLASGTGLAAAHTAGIAALLLEWGIVRDFYPDIDTVEIRKFLIRGANRKKTLQYPNRDWGYGAIDIYNVFNVLRSAFPNR